MAKTDSFVHLHTHTEFSLLDGAAGVKPLMGAVVANGMNAIAQTDHGNMLGTYQFYKAALDAGVKPIIGIEAYLTPGHTPRQHKKPVLFSRGGPDDVSAGGKYTHMTMLASTPHAAHNLIKMSSQAFLDGVYGKPRIDRPLLAENAKGIIATTGCPSGEVQTYLRLNMYDKAVAAAAEFRDMLDEGHFFVELMDHGLEIETRVRDDLLKLSKDLNLPLVATNDLHYIHKDEAKKHEHLLCLNSGSTMLVPPQHAGGKRFAFDGDSYYLKSPAEMRHLFRDLPEACDNTLLIAEMVDLGTNMFAKQDLMPRFPTPDGVTEAELFEQQVWAGMETRFPGGIPDEARKQAVFEIGVINDMGFPGYFLVVADFINYAKNKGIRVGPGRGSGAGSICAYAMRITDIDPLRHGLIFERFLNPARVSMPDFDIDFDELRRGEVINYVTEKYGDDHVAQIVTLGRMKAKQATKDSARILGYPHQMGEKLNDSMPAAVMGKSPSLPELFDSSHKRYNEGADFRALVNGSKDAQEIIDVAKGIEGSIRQTGIHAAGVIMSNTPLMDVVPVFVPKVGDGVVTQWEYPTLEDMGMVKMDFLGLSNLTVIDIALENIRENRGVVIDTDDLTETLDDPKTYELLASGDTLGVFQLDGGGMRSLLKQMRPDNFEDISAVLALYRPGPMGVNAHTDYAERKNGRQPVTPIHPELKDALESILGETYGLIVYQEQVMAIAQRLAGYTLGEADNLRRAMGKKKKEELDKAYTSFEAGMQANGFSASAIKVLWDTLLPFADYAFNKAHSAAYGVISYYIAWLKANYPVEYMAALLTHNRDDKDKMALYLNECRRMGIKVLSPDVNTSRHGYTPVGEEIRVGLLTIRAVGAGVVDGIIAARNDKGAFESFPDFVAKVERKACGKQAVAALVKAGAFDTLHGSRRALHLIHEDAIESSNTLKKAEEIGQDSLFGGVDDDVASGVTVQVPDVEEWDRKTLLNMEREMLGMYVSDHPLNGVSDLLRAKTEVSVGTLLAESGRYKEKKVTFGGLVTSLERKVTKKGDPWCPFVIEDIDGSIEVLAFPKTYTTCGDRIRQDEFLIVSGRVQIRDDSSVNVIADDIRVLDTAQAAVPDPIVVHTHASMLTPDVIAGLRVALERTPGKVPVQLRVRGDASTMVYELDASLSVTKSNTLITDLKILLGTGCFGT